MMKTTIPTQIDKCKGAMLATAIGDAMGWPNEQRAKNTKKNSVISDSFIEWSRRCSKPCWHTEKILAGEYSDDTQLTLSVARSIIAGNWEDQFTKKELPFWLTYERGGGRALLQAAKSYKNGILPWQSKYATDYFNAGGNGVVMRILPHVINSADSSNFDELMTVVIKDAFMTHGHPRAILGATCYAFALNYLLKKESVLEYGELVDELIASRNIWGALPDSNVFSDWLDCARISAHYEYFDGWNHSVDYIIRQLQYIKSALRKGLILEDSKVLTKLECFSSVNGAGDVTVLGAVYLASKYANNPTLGIKVPAFAVGADTDTLASITGGLLGMLCGTAWIPVNWKMVQDYEGLLQITELLLVSNKKEVSKSVVSETRRKAGKWENTPIGWVRKLDTIEYEAGKNRLISISKYGSALGQTFYTKSYTLLEQNAETQISLYSNLDHAPESVSNDPDRIISASCKKNREFTLSYPDVIVLLACPALKNRTFGKILHIIQELLVSKESNEAIAQKLRIDKDIVDTLIQYLN